MAFFLDVIYNKDASLFIHQKKIIIYLVRMVESHEFQDDYILGNWKYSTLIVHELRLRMLAIFKWVNVLWSVSKGALVRINTPMGRPGRRVWGDSEVTRIWPQHVALQVGLD